MGMQCMVTEVGDATAARAEVMGLWRRAARDELRRWRVAADEMVLRRRVAEMGCGGGDGGSGGGAGRPNLALPRRRVAGWDLGWERRQGSPNGESGLGRRSVDRDEETRQPKTETHHAREEQYGLMGRKISPINQKTWIFLTEQRPVGQLAQAGCTERSNGHKCSEVEIVRSETLMA